MYLLTRGNGGRGEFIGSPDQFTGNRDLNACVHGILARPEQAAGMEHDDDRRLTRDDFEDYEAWLRYCHQGGIDLAREAEDSGEVFTGIDGKGFYASLLGNILGHSRREYSRAWCGRGWTSAIQVHQFEKAYRAVAFANCLGVTMNTTLDISWSTAGVTDDLLVADRQKYYLDALRRWFVRNQQWAAWLWVLERGDRFGLHTHVMLHVPDDLSQAFRRYASNTLDHIVGGRSIRTPSSKTILIRHRNGEQLISQWWWFRYIMKGITQERGWVKRSDPHWSKNFTDRTGIDAEPQGIVSVKRLGVSRALDIASFKRWAALNDFPDMRILAEGDALYDDRFIRWYHDHRDSLCAPVETRNGNAQPTNGTVIL